MYQIDNSTAAQAIPASTTPGSKGYFTDGNPATGTPATILPAEFMNMLMMENLNVLAAAGIVPDKSKFNQLAVAISTITGSNLTWTNLGGKPTTVAGFGITDAYTKSQADNLLLAKANKATTLSGYGINDAIKIGDGGFLGVPNFYTGAVSALRSSQLLAMQAPSTTDMPSGVSYAAAIHVAYPQNVAGDKFAFDLTSSMTSDRLFYRRVQQDGSGSYNEVFTTANFNPATKADASTVTAQLATKADATATANSLALCMKLGQTVTSYNNPRFGSGNTPNFASGPTVNTGAPEINNESNTAASAALLFHRVGVSAGYLGIDTDNQLKWGGGSYGANAYTLYHQGNLGAATETVPGLVQISSTTVANGGADNTTAMSPVKVASRITAALNTTYGYNRVYLDVTTTRSSGVSYTNTSGAPIGVLVTLNTLAGAETTTITVNGLTVYSGDPGVGQQQAPIYFAVPNGASYAVTVSGSVIQRWVEMR